MGMMEEVRSGAELTATFDTTEGTIVVRLFSKDAPKTVENFVGLATGEKEWTHPATGEKMKGTPLYGLDPLDPLEFVRTIAVARITMPKARVRLSAGRRELGEAVQAMCFMAGANSIFYGDKLLTTDNPEANDDRALLEKLGLKTRSATLESVQKESCGC